MSVELVQVKLSHTLNTATRTKRVMTCMVENRPGIKVGNSLTLKDDENPDVVWDIESVSRPIRKESVHRTWNNNI